MFWVYVIGGPLLLIVGFLAYLQITDAMKEKQVRHEGRLVLGTLLMANQTMLDPEGDPEAPGFALIVLDPPTPEIRDELVELGPRLHALYTELPDSVSQSEAVQEFGESLKEHNYTENRRRRVPKELTGGRVVYVVDLYVKRDRLPEGWEDHRTLACMATGDDEGRVILLRLDEPEAVTFYRSMGVT